MKALLADKIVADVLKRNHVVECLRTSTQLVAALEFKSFGGDDNDEYGFEDYLLSSFAFHYVEGDRVAVRRM